MKMNQYTLAKHKKGQTLQLLIYGDIGAGDIFSEPGVSAKGIAEILADNPDVSDIEVRINSAGGSAFDGVSIYNLLRQHPAPVTVFIDGLAASAASIVAMAGAVVNIATGAMIMIHSARTHKGGDSSDMRKQAAVLTALDEQMAAIYMDRNGLDLAATLELMEAETWFTAAQAVEAGLADNVVGAVEAVASYDLAAYDYKNAPDTRSVYTPPTITTTAPTTAHGDNDMKILAQAAGLPESATEAEIVAKIQNVSREFDTATKLAEDYHAKLTRLTAAVGAEGDEALGKIEAGKVALQMVEEQTKELADIKAQTEKDAHATLIEQGKKDGKLTADLSPYFSDKSAAELEAYLAVAPKVVPVGDEKTPAVKPAAPTASADLMQHNGKLYADMTGNEKAALADENPETFQQMSDQYRAHLNAAH